MIARFALGDLRRTWRAWLGVWITVVVAAATVTASLLVMSAADGQPDKGVGMLSRGGLASMGGTNAAFCAIVAWLMVRAAMGQLLALRGRALAAWQLVGLLPQQVGRVVPVQLLLVAATALAPAAPLGLLLAYGLLAGASAANSVPTATPTPHLTALVLILPPVLILLAALAGMRRPYRILLRTDPVIAVRDHAETEARRLRPVLLALSSLALLGNLAWLVAATQRADMPQLSTALFVLLMTLLMMLTALAPVLLVAGQRVTARHVPARLVGSWLANASLAHAPSRLVAVGTPVAIVTFLPGCLQLIADSFRASELASTGTANSSGAPLAQLLMVCGLPCLVAVVGAATALFSASQRRDGELALVALCGATPATQLRQVAAEAVTAALTGVAAGCALLAALAGAVRYALSGFLSAVVLAPPWTAVVTGAVASCLITIVASTAPAVPAMRRPAHRVHAAARD